MKNRKYPYFAKFTSTDTICPLSIVFFVDKNIGYCLYDKTTYYLSENRTDMLITDWLEHRFSEIGREELL